MRLLHILPLLAERSFRIDLALHDIKFVVDWSKACFRLDQDQSIHTVANVLGNHGRRAVVNVKAGNEGLERLRLFAPRIDLRVGILHRCWCFGADRQRQH